MRIPKILLFNFFTNQAFKQSSRYEFLGTRLNSMQTDFGFILSLVFPLFLLYGFSAFFISTQNQIMDFLNLLDFAGIFFSLITFLLLNKDALGGRSIAKRYFGYQVVDLKTKKIASQVQCVLRNTTFIIWPIEVIFILINPKRRLGDLIANTQVATTTSEPPETIISDLNDINDSNFNINSLWISLAFVIIQAVLMFYYMDIYMLPN